MAGKTRNTSRTSKKAEPRKTPKTQRVFPESAVPSGISLNADAVQADPENIQAKMEAAADVASDEFLTWFNSASKEQQLGARSTLNLIHNHRGAAGYKKVIKRLFSALNIE